MLLLSIEKYITHTQCEVKLGFFLGNRMLTKPASVITSVLPRL